jgi:exocyst complex component 4
MLAEAMSTEILRYIEQQWSFMASPSCIPVKVALQLNDSSSLGLMDQYDQFHTIGEGSSYFTNFV